MHIYDYLRLPIRVAFFAFILLGIGNFIQSESVNIFYTFRSSFILAAADIMKKTGAALVVNLPLIIMVNIVCKKANSGLPVVLAIAGYTMYLVTTMLFGPQNLPSYAYVSSSLLPLAEGRAPLQTGLIGSFLVGYLTRYAYMRSRHKSKYSLLALVNKDTTSLIYILVGCFILGLLVSYGYGYFYQLIQRAVTYISADLMDPRRIALYGVLDRSLSILGMGDLVRQPFWFTAAGGSYSNQITGGVVLGDVRIWEYIREYNTSFLGAGRFITPYYVINIFIVPAFYAGTLLFVNEASDRRHLLVTLILGAVFSILAGNPLPVELLMAFTTPFLLVFYLVLVAVLFGFMVYQKIFLGFFFSGNDASIAMPGNFPDLIINLRNAQLSDQVVSIVLVGLVCFLIMLVLTFVYYRFLAYDITSSGKKKALVEATAEAVGGAENIEKCSSGLFRLVMELKDLEKVSFDKIRELGARRITETRKGVSIEFGSSAAILMREMKKLMKESSRN